MDLWVLPGPSKSQWFARIDWYLNWQMCKGLAFEKSRPSVELFRVLDEAGAQYTAHPSDPQWPLMVISQGRIPCAKCVVLEHPSALKDWLRTIKALVQRLDLHSVRVYLPTGTSVADAAKIWQTDLREQNINIEFRSDEDIQ